MRSKKKYGRLFSLFGLGLMSLFFQGCAQYYQKTAPQYAVNYGVNASCEKSLAIQLPAQWLRFEPILCARSTQPQLKMKLTKSQVHHFVRFLWGLDAPVPALLTLSQLLPKTTLELLRSVESRGVSLTDAEAMAQYLATVPKCYAIYHIAKFDENTSHIIGRQWDEIDYRGEGMTWQQQQKKYAPYHITDFKRVENLKRFFPVESQLPYFKKAYQ